MKTFRYASNNSGGSWWLKDEDWKNLEAKGWKVDWIKDLPNDSFLKGKDGRWLGALAKSATKEFPNLGEAIADFEIITGQDYYDEGCNCCGNPHDIGEV